MTHYQIVKEIDVLLETIDFLLDRGVKPYRISSPKGKGIDRQSDEQRIWQVLTSNDIPAVYPFSDEGPDIVGISATEWWQVECKGSGAGKAQTQRNNFDRALASVVSYYEKEAKKLPKNYQGWSKAQPYWGLALPASRAYPNELKKRVRQPLRKVLNFWVLLYETESEKIRAVSPEDSY